MSWLAEIAIALIAGYLVGSVMFAYIICQMLTGTDIRELGNGNPGAANLFESVGRLGGVLTLILDVLKALVPIAIGHYFLSMSVISLGAIGIGAMVGHKFPLYFGFSGGRAAATLAGICLFFIPLEIAIAIAVSLPVLFLAKRQRKILVPIAFFLSSVGLSMFLDHSLSEKLVLAACTLCFVALNVDKFLGAEVSSQETEAHT